MRGYFINEGCLLTGDEGYHILRAVGQRATGSKPGLRMFSFRLLLFQKTEMKTDTNNFSKKKIIGLKTNLLTR